MKRTIALVLAAMMLMTLLLSGCGETGVSSQASTGATTGDVANVDSTTPTQMLILPKKPTSLCIL